MKKMISSILISPILISALFMTVFVSYSQAKTFTREQCANNDEITKEFIELELAGYRLQHKDSPCLDDLKLNTIDLSVDKDKREEERATGDDTLSNAYRILPKNRSYTIKKQTVKDVGLEMVDVVVQYLAKNQKGQDEKLELSFSYQKNIGSVREKQGCASLIEEPDVVVNKEACAKRVTESSY